MRDHLRERHGDILIFEELGVKRGSSRLDMATIFDGLHGYEFKSDKDRLHRLPGQVETFGKVVEKMTLVVGRKHLVQATTVVPDWWEVLLVEMDEEFVDVSLVREGKRNPTQDPWSLVELLWREDAMSALASLGFGAGIRKKSRRALWARICSSCSLSDINRLVCDGLRTRAASYRQASGPAVRIPKKRRRRGRGRVKR